MKLLTVFFNGMVLHELEEWPTHVGWTKQYLPTGGWYCITNGDWYYVPENGTAIKWRELSQVPKELRALALLL